MQKNKVLCVVSYSSNYICVSGSPIARNSFLTLETLALLAQRASRTAALAVTFARVDARNIFNKIIALKWI